MIDLVPATSASSSTVSGLPSSRPRITGPRALTFPELFALPTVLDLTTAARAMGISVNTAYRLIKRNEFPCVVLRPGYRYRVPTASLMKALEIEHMPLYIDDVEHGAAFAGQFG